MKKNKKNIPENYLSDEIYQRQNFPLKRIIGICLLVTSLGFFFNFPIKETIRTIVKKNIHSFKKCPISYEDV